MTLFFLQSTEKRVLKKDRADIKKSCQPGPSLKYWRENKRKIIYGMLFLHFCHDGSADSLYDVLVALAGDSEKVHILKQAQVYRRSHSTNLECLTPGRISEAMYIT